MNIKKLLFLTLLFLLNSCIRKLKEDNILAIPPFFRQEYEESLKKDYQIEKQ
jgi:hypothetical protein